MRIISIVEQVMANPILVESEQTKLPQGVLCRVTYPVCNINERNANGRIYERGVWDSVVMNEELNTKQQARTLFGHAEHPKDTTQSNLEKVSHVITNTWIDEEKNQAWQEFDVLDTPYGRIVNTLLMAECKVGCSTRAEGELEESEDDIGKYQRVIPESYRYITTDFTADPSTFGVYPAKVERDVVDIVKTGVDEDKIDREFAVHMLEQFQGKEAVALLEAISNDKQHEGCTCKTSEKKCTKGCACANEKSQPATDADWKNSVTISKVKDKWQARFRGNTIASDADKESLVAKLNKMQAEDNEFVNISVKENQLVVRKIEGDSEGRYEIYDYDADNFVGTYATEDDAFDALGYEQEEADARAKAKKGIKEQEHGMQDKVFKFTEYLEDGMAADVGMNDVNDKFGEKIQYLDPNESYLDINDDGTYYANISIDSRAAHDNELSKNEELTKEAAEFFEAQEDGGFEDKMRAWVESKGWKVLETGNTYNEDSVNWWGSVYEYVDFSNDPDADVQKEDPSKTNRVVMWHLGGDVRGNYELPIVYDGDADDRITYFERPGDVDEEIAHMFGYEGNKEQMAKDVKDFVDYLDTLDDDKNAVDVPPQEKWPEDPSQQKMDFAAESIKEGQKWEYEDGAGVKRTGTFVKSSEGQGSDVTYFFKRDTGETDAVSGEKLKRARGVQESDSRGGELLLRDLVANKHVTWEDREEVIKFYDEHEKEAGGDLYKVMSLWIDAHKDDEDAGSKCPECGSQYQGFNCSNCNFVEPGRNPYESITDESIIDEFANRGDLISDFMAGATKGKASSLKADGDVLYSYATPIALRKDGTVYVNKQGYSKTTTIQQNALERAGAQVANDKDFAEMLSAAGVQTGRFQRENESRMGGSSVKSLREMVMSYAMDSARNVMDSVMDNFDWSGEDVPKDVVKTMEQEVKRLKMDSGFIRGLAENIEEVWSVNPTAEEVQIIFLGSPKGLITFDYIGAIDMWQGASWTHFPYRSHVPVPSQEEAGVAETRIKRHARYSTGLSIAEKAARDIKQQKHKKLRLLKDLGCKQNEKKEIKESKKPISLLEVKRQINELQINLAEAKATNEKVAQFYNVLHMEHDKALTNYSRDVVDYNTMVDDLTKMFAAMEESRSTVAEKAIVETKKVLEARHQKISEDFNGMVDTLKAQYEEELEELRKESRKEIKTISESLGEITTSKATIAQELEEAHVKYTSEINEKDREHEKALVNKYVDCILEFSGLQIPENARALLRQCNTEKEAEDLIERIRDIMRETSLHYSGSIDNVIVNDSLENVSPVEQQLYDRIETVFEGINGKK